MKDPLIFSQKGKKKPKTIGMFDFIYSAFKKLKVKKMYLIV